jgi:predicted solute-binding protein
LEELSTRWSERLALPVDRVRDYFFNVMQYDLDRAKMEGLELYRDLCRTHGLIAPST